jgi:transcription initiation factor TFIIIB Brf1 subunit/transcription initiation factor TFIIB
MTIRFCWVCGSGYNKDLWRDRFVCSECGAVFEVPKIIKQSQITLEEAQANFSKIPLTDKKAVQAQKRRK